MQNFKEPTFYKAGTLFMLLFFLSLNLAAQTGRLSDFLESKYQFNTERETKTVSIEPFSLERNATNTNTLKKWVKDEGGNLYSLDKKSVQNLIKTSPERVLMKIPDNTGTKLLELDLVKVNLLTDEFAVSDSKDNKIKLKDENSIQYQGFIKGRKRSLVAISLLADGSISGMVSDKNLDLFIGKMKNSDQHIIYNASDIIPSSGFECKVTDPILDERNLRKVQAEMKSSGGGGCQTIGVYFEIDYDLFQKKGSSIQNTVSYISAVFNQVKVLYANEGIDIEISGIKVWNTPDPYTIYNDIDDVVNHFRNNLNGDFPGHLANFISGRIEKLGGGMAYDIPASLCYKENQVQVSAIYDTFENIPVYSWTVFVITHEMGHVLGSRHTHWCGWIGGPIDGCAGIAEQDSTGASCPVGPIPSEGGTIMSYCHQKPVGVNFNLGFGTQPGNIIRWKISNAECINTHSETDIPQNLTVGKISGNRATLHWDEVVGAAYYQIEYKKPLDETWNYAGQSPLNTFKIDLLDFNTNYEWRVKTSCSDYSLTDTFATRKNLLTLEEPLPFDTFCKNSFVAINYSISQFLPGNQIYIELSDSSGSFSSPLQVGMIYSNTSGIITANIPNTITDGSHFRFRLRGTSPITVGDTTEFFTVINENPVNFLSFRAENPSDDSFRFWVSTEQPAKVYYIVVNNGIGIKTPTAEQIISGKEGNNLNALKSGMINVSIAGPEFHKIIGNLLEGMDYVIFATLDAFSECQKPVVSALVSTENGVTIPASCKPVLNCTDEDIIDSFSIQAIGLQSENTGCSAAGYADRTSTAYLAKPGNEYTFDLKIGSTWPDYVKIWIDGNQNGIFEPAELIFSSSKIYSGIISQITMPGTTGFVKMRVMVNYYSNSNPCLADNDYGEAEDFLLYLSDEDQCPEFLILTSPENDVEGGIGKIFQAENLSVTNQVKTGSAADYIGTKVIEFLPGFQIETGTTFNAKIIGNCKNDE